MTHRSSRRPAGDFSGAPNQGGNPHESEIRSDGRCGAGRPFRRSCDRDAGACGRRNQDRRHQQLHAAAGAYDSVPARGHAGDRGDQQGRRRARQEARLRLARRPGQAGRGRQGRRAAALARQGGADFRLAVLAYRPGAGLLGQAAQDALSRRRAAGRRAGLGQGQQLHLPPASLDLHAGGDARGRSGQAQGSQALGDDRAELRLRQGRRRGVQENPDQAASRRDVRRGRNGRACSRSTPAPRSRRSPRPSRTASTTSPSAATLRNSSAKAGRAACSRAS